MLDSTRNKLKFVFLPAALDKVTASMPEEELKAKEEAVTGGVLPRADAPTGKGAAEPPQKSIPEGQFVAELGLLSAAMMLGFAD